MPQKNTDNPPWPLDPRIKSTERDCPRCDAVLVENKKEDCYECLKCGYIDCGEENIIPKIK